MAIEQCVLAYGKHITIIPTLDVDVVGARLTITTLYTFHVVIKVIGFRTKVPAQCHILLRGAPSMNTVSIELGALLQGTLGDPLDRTTIRSHCVVFLTAH
jgi:hypothetical protein